MEDDDDEVDEGTEDDHGKEGAGDRVREYAEADEVAVRYAHHGERIPTADDVRVLEAGFRYLDHDIAFDRLQVLEPKRHAQRAAVIAWGVRFDVDVRIVLNTIAGDEGPRVAATWTKLFLEAEQAHAVEGTTTAIPAKLIDRVRELIRKRPELKKQKKILEALRAKNQGMRRQTLAAILRLLERE